MHRPHTCKWPPRGGAEGAEQICALLGGCTDVHGCVGGLIWGQELGRGRVEWCWHGGSGMRVMGVEPCHMGGVAIMG